MVFHCFHISSTAYCESLKFCRCFFARKQLPLFAKSNRPSVASDLASSLSPSARSLVGSLLQALKPVDLRGTFERDVLPWLWLVVSKGRSLENTIDISPIYHIAGWWFQTWLLFSISYMGCHPSHWLSYFSRWLLHHQQDGKSDWASMGWDDLVGGDWNHGILWLSIQLGISSSQLTNSYFSEG